MDNFNKQDAILQDREDLDTTIGDDEGQAAEPPKKKKLNLGLFLKKSIKLSSVKIHWISQHWRLNLKRRLEKPRRWLAAKSILIEIQNQTRTSANR